MISTRFATQLALLTALILGGALTAQAQDYDRFMHWPYVPPQVPGNGFDYKPIYDGFYLYPKEMRIQPQIQGSNYYNFYGGQRLFGHFRRSWIPWGFNHPNKPPKYYQGYHFVLDVF